MKTETKLKIQLEACKKWARMARKENKTHFLNNIGLWDMQIAIEQIINYLEMKEKYE